MRKKLSSKQRLDQISKKAGYGSVTVEDAIKRGDFDEDELFATPLEKWAKNQPDPKSDED